MAKEKATTTASSTDDREGRESKEIRALILWARANRIRLGEVQVGMTRMVLDDLAIPSAPVARKPTDEELRQNLYAEFGGEALKQLTAEPEGEDGYDGSEESDDEPDEPVVG